MSATQSPNDRPFLVGWSDIRPWAVLIIVASTGPLWAYLVWVAMAPRFAISGGIAGLALAYGFQALQSLLIGLVAMFSFQIRGRVALMDVLAAGIFAGAAAVAIYSFSSSEPAPNLRGVAANIGFPTVSALGGWLLVQGMRKQGHA